MSSRLLEPLNNTSNPILHEKSKSYYWTGTGALSLKTFRNGKAFYQTGQGHFAVDEGNYLLINRGQEYSITIESETLVESFCIFFPDGWIEEVYRSMATPVEKHLADPFQPHLLEIDFIEKTYTNDPTLAPALFQLRDQYSKQALDSIWLEEKLYDITFKLLQVHRGVIQEIAKVSSLRTSTKEELYKRIHLARDYISAYYDQPVSLADMARVAALSPSHFLRAFKQITGITPHQFIIEKRLQEAKKLLLQTDKPITDICLNIGFQSLSSFSWLFSQRFAISPSKYRRKK